MKKKKDIGPKDIEEMNYNELISLTKETNRPPGGKETVFEIINRTCIDSGSKVLEIGTSTGFTSIEIRRMVECSSIAIDINESSLKEARKRANNEGFDDIEFIKADVNKLPFKDSEFDLVILGNILSLMDDKDKAFGECKRVCKDDGFIAVVPMYYLEEPPNSLIEKISKAVGTDITPRYKKDWKEYLDMPSLEIYWEKDYKFNYIEDEDVENFVDLILDRDHLKNKLNEETFSILNDKYADYMFLFRDNLLKMGFSIFLLANDRIWEDPELFSSTAI